MPPDSSAGLLGLLDWAVVAAYTGGLILLGLLMSRRHIAPVDYFLASRATRWPVIGLALLASNMSSTALVGLAGGAYAMGVAVYDYEWSAIVILVFFCLFLLPSIIRSQIYTMPEFLERRYDRRVRLYFALLTLFLNIFVDSAGVLYSGSLVCQLLFPAWPLWLIVALLAGTAGLYTTLGGLRAVIYTEAVQAIVLMLGALMISIGAFSRAGGWSTVMHGVPRRGAVAHPAARRFRGSVARIDARHSAAGILLLVHQPIDRAAHVVGQEPRSCPLGRAVRRLAEAAGAVPDRTAGHLRAAAVPEVAARRFGVSALDPAPAAGRPRRVGGRRIRRGHHGVDCLPCPTILHVPAKNYNVMGSGGSRGNADSADDQGLGCKGECYLLRGSFLEIVSLIIGIAEESRLTGHRDKEGAVRGGTGPRLDHSNPSRHHGRRLPLAERIQIAHHYL